MAIQAQIYSGFCLGSSQDLPMDNCCGLNNLCFIHQQKPQQERELMQRNIVPSLSALDNQQSLAFSQIISAQMENQRIEIDQLINSQNQRLGIVLQEYKKQQLALLKNKYESKIEFIFKQKEEEVSRAANRTMELQYNLKKLEIESQTWQRVAKENEAKVASLNREIQRLRETGSNAPEDAESCCFNGDEKIKERTRNLLVCRFCNWRKSCVVMLPCSHLCSCRDCEPLIDSCPVCKMMKKGNIEALV